MRITTGLLLGAALILGTFSLGGCDDEDSGKKGQTHEAHAVVHPDSSATTGPGWIATSGQHMSVWSLARPPAALANSHLVTTNAPPPQSAAPPSANEDPLNGIRAAIGANMLPSRDSVRVTGLVNRALQAADTPADTGSAGQPTAVLITTPWNDDTLLLWIAIPGGMVGDTTAVKVEFDPKTVATFRALGDPSDMSVAPGTTLRLAMLYELSPMQDTAPPKAVVAKYGVVHLSGAVADQPKIDRPITAADMIGGIDNAPDAVRFAVAVAGFGGLLRGDPALRDLSCNDAIALAEDAVQPDPDGWRAQMLALMHGAEPLLDLPPREPAPADDPPK